MSISLGLGASASATYIDRVNYNHWNQNVILGKNDNLMMMGNCIIIGYGSDSPCKNDGIHIGSNIKMSTENDNVNIGKIILGDTESKQVTIPGDLVVKGDLIKIISGCDICQTERNYDKYLGFSWCVDEHEKRMCFDCIFDVALAFKAKNQFYDNAMTMMQNNH